MDHQLTAMPFRQIDPMQDLLDDMASIATHWERNRQRGRTPHAIRAAMVMIARDIVAMADAEPPKDTP